MNKPRIELALTNPLLVEHFAPVARALQRRGCDVTCSCVPPARLVRDRDAKQSLHERCVEAARQADLPVRLKIDPDCDVALTALGANTLHLYRGIKLKLRYGVSLHRAAIHHNRAMTQGFDGLLAHGPFERELFARWIARERIRLIGMPRHAGHFARQLSRSKAHAQLGVSAAPGRAVIVYLPTWSVQSSLRTFQTALSALTLQHSLLVKPHTLSLDDPASRAAVAQLAHAGARVLGPTTELALLIAAADLIITDATSGATCEAALLSPETPLVLLTLRTLEELFNAIDQLGPIVQQPETLADVVRAELQADTHRTQRALTRAELFADFGDRAPEIAAEAILELMQMPKISPRPGLVERSFPRPFRVLRGQLVRLGVARAAIPPRNIGPQ
jgi:hypothetical protein